MGESAMFTGVCHFFPSTAVVIDWMSSENPSRALVSHAARGHV